MSGLNVLVACSDVVFLPKVPAKGHNQNKALFINLSGYHVNPYNCSFWADLPRQRRQGPSLRLWGYLLLQGSGEILQRNKQPSKRMNQRTEKNFTVCH